MDEQPENLLNKRMKKALSMMDLPSRTAELAELRALKAKVDGCVVGRIADNEGPWVGLPGGDAALYAATLLAWLREGFDGCDRPTPVQVTPEQERLARLGAAFELLQPCPTDSQTDYWRGYADGWNGAQKWVRDNASFLEETP